MTSGSSAAMHDGLASDLAARASAMTVGELMRLQSQRTPERIAVADRDREVSYRAFNERVNRLAHALTAQGIIRGDRIGILSENRLEYVETLFAAAKLGAILATLNWRLTGPEVAAALAVSAPKLILVSERYQDMLAEIAHGAEVIWPFGRSYEDRLAGASEEEPEIAATPEDGLIIVYTSGTTGPPKGALVSHRAEIARLQIGCISYGLDGDDAALAWTPMFHVASLDPMLHVLCLGGKVVVVDGFDLERIINAIAEERIWWLVLIPGMLDRLIEALRERSITPRKIKLAGAQADLLPRHQIAEVSALLQAPFWNTFGCTECGIPIVSGNWFPIGEVPERLSKTQDIMNQIRLVDADDNEVPDGEPGEIAYRGPSLFSGYWNAPEVNAHDFRGGWFHTGDVLRRNPDGTYDFVDRVKYMIKSGGENIYPAEIESLLLRDPRIDDAVVIRRADRRWGEVPTAFIARNDESLTADYLADLCRENLAGYKRPKEFRFVAMDDFPRSTAGKVQRHEVEKWLSEEERPAGSQFDGERRERT